MNQYDKRTIPTPRYIRSAATAAGIALLSAALAACFASGGGAAPAAPSIGGQLSGTGSMQVSGRVNSSGLTPQPAPATQWPTASPDGFTVVADEIALSSDGVNYQTVVQGPIQLDFAASSDRPVFSSQVSLPAGRYQAVRLKISSMSWHATWDNANRSPCAGDTSGQAQGTVPLNGHTTFYFKTGAAGGNTRVHYAASPKQPFLPPNYIGDVNNPLLLAAPLVVTDGHLTTLDLVLSAEDKVACSGLGAFDIPADHSAATPALSLAGEQTLLMGGAGAYIDTDNNRIGVVNALNHSITLYKTTDVTGSGGDVSPITVDSGPTTRLNAPGAVAWYHNPIDSTQDQIIVANSGNDSVATYPLNNQGGNIAPVRTIRGIHDSELNVPTGVALWIDPNPGSNTQLTGDEIWVTDRGSNSASGDKVTAYSRLDDQDVTPLYRIFGPQTQLHLPCGIALSAYGGTDRILVTNNKIPNGADLDRVTIYNRSSVLSQGQGGDPTSGDVAPAYIIEGAQTGLATPCGIAVDDTTGDIYVANSGNGTVTVYANADLPAGGGQANIAPVQVINGLSGPYGLLWDASQRRLWVTQRGTVPTMSAMPHIAYVASDQAAPDAVLTGKYNVVAFGADLQSGTNRLGIPIAMPVTERGKVTFNPASDGSWSDASFNVDTHYARRIMDRGCDLPIDDSAAGFYDTTSLHGLNMFLGPGYGAITGAYSADGQYFIGTSYEPGSHMLIMFGIKDTGGNSPAFGAGGPTVYYNFGEYDLTLLINRDNPNSKSKNDVLRYTAHLGTAQMTGTDLAQLSLQTGFETAVDPMGDQSAPTLVNASFQSANDLLGRGIGVTTHAGGQVEISSQSLGFIGAAAGNGDLAVFMGDSGASNLDGFGCPIELNYSIALRDTAPVNLTGIQGNYYVAAFGDLGNTGTSPVRPPFRVTAGNLSFDGKGGGQWSLTESDEGEVVESDIDFIYRVRAMSIGGGSATVIDMYQTAQDANPMASAIVGPGLKTLLFYEPLSVTTAGTSGNGNGERLMGLAIYQGK